MYRQAVHILHALPIRLSAQGICFQIGNFHSKLFWPSRRLDQVKGRAPGLSGNRLTFPANGSTGAANPLPSSIKNTLRLGFMGRFTPCTPGTCRMPPEAALDELSVVTILLDALCRP